MSTPSESTLVQIARLYYQEEKSQQQIADEIGVSRSLVALYLKRAKDRGIVTFEIHNPQDNYEYLENYLIENASIARVTVVPTASNPALTRRAVASALARHLERNLQDGDVLGIGFGRTLSELPSLFAPRHPRKAFVVPLVGESASSYRRSFSQINRTVLQISQACDGIPYFLLAPLLVDTPELCQLLRADATIAPVVEKWDKLDHACIGIGTCPPIEDEVVYIGEDNVKKYKALGAIGDTCTRYFDAQGNYIKTDIHDRTIGVTIDQLFKARNLYIVGAGAGKTDAICAFIEKKKSVNLFIDEELATQMVRKIGGTSK